MRPVAECNSGRKARRGPSALRAELCVAASRVSWISGWETCTEPSAVPPGVEEATAIFCTTDKGVALNLGMGGTGMSTRATGAQTLTERNTVGGLGIGFAELLTAM